MTLKNIKISEFIYKKLLEKKKEDESISDVIERLLEIEKEPKDIKKCFGIWKDLPAEYFDIIESDIKETREAVNRRFL